MKKFNAGGGIQTWTTPSGKFGLGAGPVSPITNVATQGATAGAQGITGLFNPTAIGAGLAYGLARNLSEKRKAERQKNDNLFLLTVDEMRKAGVDPYEMYPVEMFDTSQYEDLAGLPTSGTPQEMQSEAIAQAVYHWRQRNQDVVQKAYDDFLASGMDYEDYKQRTTSSKPEDAVTLLGLTNTQNGTSVDTIRDLINKGAVNAGEVWDKVTGTFSKVFQMPGMPDWTVFNPFDPSATVTWGKTGGSPTIPVGTTPGGTSTSATTGIPAVDRVLADVIDVIMGRAGAGDLIPTEEEIREVLAGVLKTKYGLPGDMSVDDVLAEASTAASRAWERRQRLGEGDDTGKGGTVLDLTKKDCSDPAYAIANPEECGPGGTDSGTDDGTTTVDDGTTKVDDGTDLNKTPATTTSDEDEYLDLNELLPASDETPDETPSAPTGGGAGVGYTQGVGVTSGAPGPTVDIDYLYDIAGSSIFNPAMGRTEEEKEDKKNKRGPYVYARSGGMIQNNYDLLDEVIRLLRG